VNEALSVAVVYHPASWAERDWAEEKCGVAERLPLGAKDMSML